MGKRLSKREIERLADELPSESRTKALHGSYHHVAELYGESETRGLSPWARRRVLSFAR